MPLARSEGRERPDSAADDLVATANLGRPFDHDEPGALAHLMIVHRLAGLETDRDRAGAVVRHQHGRIDGAARRVDLRQIPRLHGWKLSRLTA